MNCSQGAGPNATGVYAQLVAAHVGSRGEAAAVLETQDAVLAAKIEVAAGKVADLDRLVGDRRPAQGPCGARQ